MTKKGKIDLVNKYENSRVFICNTKEGDALFWLMIEMNRMFDQLRKGNGSPDGRQININDEQFTLWTQNARELIQLINEFLLSMSADTGILYKEPVQAKIISDMLQKLQKTT